MLGSPDSRCRRHYCQLATCAPGPRLWASPQKTPPHPPPRRHMPWGQELLEARAWTSSLPPVPPSANPPLPTPRCRDT